MNSKVKLCFLSLVLFSYISDLSSQIIEKNLGVIPAPQFIEMQDGRFYAKQGQQMAILYEGMEAQKNAKLLQAFLREKYNQDIPVMNKAKKDQKTILFKSSLQNDFGKEGYSLSITPSMIKISGVGAGLFYGLQTLTQIIYGSNEQKIDIPCAEIKDAPRFAYRGIMQDVGYHIYPVDFIKKQIDWLAQYKLNVYHWHLTEDHGWRIEIKKYPEVTKIGAYREQTVVSNYKGMSGLDGTPYGGYYSQEDVREIVKYAEDRYVTVIPEIELPGHSLAALASYPHLACGNNPGPFKVAQHWGIYDDVYCAGKEETFQFLEDVLSEVIDLFPSRYIHIGGDECPKARWKECKYCQQRIKDNNLKDEYELQSYFVKRIEKFVNGKGRHIIGWDEIREGGLAPDATVMAWRSVEEGIKAAQEFHDVVMAPVDYLYFDYVQGKRNKEPLAIAWGVNDDNPEWGIVSMETVYNFNPIPPGLTPDQQKHIIGVEAPIWTEHIDTQRKVEYMMLPRLMALAEIGWSPENKKDLKNFKEERLPVHLAWLDGTDAIYRVPTPIGIEETTYKGAVFDVELKVSVKGATIYYNFEGQEPRETDFIYEKPIRIIVPKGEMRELNTITVTPSGKRSISVTSIFDNK